MRALIAFVVCMMSSSAFAGCDLDDLVGWTLIARKTIVGRIQNEERKDDFEGCDFSRIIVFDDNTGVQCTGYSYMYSYRPKAYIWGDGSSLKMCVGSNEFSVGRIN